PHPSRQRLRVSVEYAQEVARAAVTGIDGGHPCLRRPPKGERIAAHLKRLFVARLRQAGRQAAKQHRGGYGRLPVFSAANERPRLPEEDEEVVALAAPHPGDSFSLLHVPVFV